MKTEWDYTALADAYLSRPDYADDALDNLLHHAGISTNADVCDVGAGVAHLTLMLLKRGLRVVAVEPNDAMRIRGVERTRGFDSINWVEGTGEHTGQPSKSFDLVTFGSSFNVTDRALALKESARILRPRGWFACMWNHRNLQDPLQAEIERIIKANVSGYDYGTRREDQTAVINSSGLFGDVRIIEGTVSHSQSRSDCIEAWRSHATLQRQAGVETFHKIVTQIEQMLIANKVETLIIPYTTRIWVARLND